MLTSRFTDEDGVLHFFDKRTPEKGVLASNPKNVFVVSHLYSTIEKDGTRDTALEKYYSRVESGANQIIEKLVQAARARRLPMLSAEEKKAWDVFVYHQWSRVPDLHVKTLVHFDEAFRESVAEFEATHRPLTVEERLSLATPEAQKRLKQNARVKALSASSGEAIDALGTKGLGIAVVDKPNESFIIGSFPVVKLTYPGRTHISDPSVEVWLPIAPDVAVTPSGSPGTEQVTPIVNDRHIRALNEATFLQSTVIAGRSHALIASIAGCK